MADPINYSGYTYDQSAYKLPTETMADYMQRLAAQRAAGVLGGGGMLDTTTPITEMTSSALGEVTQNCAEGYYWNGSACVPKVNNDQNQQEAVPKVQLEDIYKNARYLLDNPEVRQGLMAGATLLPITGLSAFLTEDNLNAFVRNTQNEGTKSQSLLQRALGQSGDVVIGAIEPSMFQKLGNAVGIEPTADKYVGYLFDQATNAYLPQETAFGGGRGSLVTGTASPVSSTIRSMFPEIFDAAKFTLDPAVIASYAEDTALTGSGSGSSSDPYTPSWSASDASSWDTSGGGTNADGTYDISSWFNG